MRCLKRGLLAGLLLLLSLAGVDMEHLQAENLNLLPQHEHNLVLNRGMRGKSMQVFHFSQLYVMFAFVGEAKCFLWRIFQTLADDDKVYLCVFVCDSPVIAFKCCVTLSPMICVDSPVGVGQIPVYT